MPVDTGTASAPAALDQAALTSLIFGVVTGGAGALTSSIPLAGLRLPEGDIDALGELDGPQRN